jgi:hypothetical protein
VVAVGGRRLRALGYVFPCSDRRWLGWLAGGIILCLFSSVTAVISGRTASLTGRIGLTTGDTGTITGIGQDRNRPRGGGRRRHPRRLLIVRCAPEEFGDVEVGIASAIEDVAVPLSRAFLYIFYGGLQLAHQSVLADVGEYLGRTLLQAKQKR